MVIEYKLWAVVINWNLPKDTLECLRSLTCQEGVNLHILVVDNASTDDSVQQICASYPHVQLITNTANLGFGFGANQGIEYAVHQGADYILLINNDAILASDAVLTIIEKMHEGIGLAAPMIYYYSEKNIIWSAGGKEIPFLLETRKEFANQKDLDHWPSIMDRDFLTACCLIIPRKLVERVGLFDTQHFRHFYEDADLSIRVKKAGLRMIVVPAAKAWHKVSRSTGGRDAPSERYWMGRSSVVFYKKHAKSWNLVLIIPWRFLSALRTTARLMLKLQWKSLHAYWLGLWHGFVEPNENSIPRF